MICTFPRLLRAWLIASLAAAAPCGWAQNTPAPARILVGFSAGGSFDTIARLIAGRMGPELNRTVIVENRPGAGSRLAVDALKSAPNDGSVVLLGPESLVALYPFSVRKISYDPKVDLVPIGTVAEFPFALVVGERESPRSLKEYLAWVREHPEKANYGMPALGSPHHFFAIQLGKATSTDLSAVPFQGSAPMLIGLMGGHVAAGVDNMGSLLEPFRNGKLRMLAVSSPQRMPQAQDVPTFAEQGLPSITGMGFNALFAPRGTPAEAIARWSRALNHALSQPEVRDQIFAMGMLPVGKGPQELAARSEASAKRWEPVIRSSGFQVD